MIKSTFKVTVLNAYNIGWLLYIVIPALLTLSDVFLASHSVSFEIFAIFGLSIAAWYLGIWSYFSICSPSHKILASKEEYLVPLRSNRLTANTGFTIIVILILSMLVLQVNSLYDGFDSYFSSSYGNYNVDNVNSFSSSAAFIIIGSIFGCKMACQYRLRLNQFMNALAIFVTLFWIAGGLRNIAAMLAIGFVFMLNVNRRLPTLTILLVILSSLVAAAFIAVFRNYAIMALLTGEVNISEIASDAASFSSRYLDGEFGTPYRVYLYLKSTPSLLSIVPAKSYLLDPIINLVPTIINHERSPTLSVLFTYEYFNTTNPPEGLGFSLINEAIINFGFFFFPIPLFFFGFIIALISRRNERSFHHSTSLNIFSVALASVSLNLFRIDFAIYIKFLVIIFLSAQFAYYFCKRFS